MNFLAHASLSPANDHVLVGNFFGDSFKGRPEKFGPDGVVAGIRLHREIDRYTDTHPLVLETIKLFREQQGRFAPVVVDMVFDHFLAANFNQWGETDLLTFSTSIYSRLDENESHIPESALRFYPHMRRHNALLRYGGLDGLKFALERMDMHISVTTELARSTDLVELHRTELNQLFSAFFQDLINHVKSYLGSIEAEIGSSRVPLK